MDAGVRCFGAAAFAGFAEALGVGDAVGVPSPPVVRFRFQSESFHQPLAATGSARWDGALPPSARVLPLFPQSVQAMATDGIATAPTAAAAMTIRR
ncbi:hypothetical protein ABZ920_28075 [Streptomyces sp. NPDC046831]|uniref:hypothetical protein n=1 Tax=Streptomyces sp. NPDC046831 TaxID=3154805 RepID=UPI0033FD20BC